MQRDYLKDLNYFRKRIEFSSMAIEKFEIEIEKRKETDLVASEYGSPGIAKYALDKIKAQYSYGVSVDEIRPTIEKYVYNELSTWKSEFGFRALLDSLSLSVLVGISEECLCLARCLINDVGIEDVLIDNFLHYFDESWEIKSTRVMYPKLYSRLEEMFDASSIELKKEALKDYLKVWYELNEDSGWHDSHLSAKNSYVGYWCFEAGAIAKVLKIDDSDLKEVKYYPYDLVHYIE